MSTTEYRANWRKEDQQDIDDTREKLTSTLKEVLGDRDQTSPEQKSKGILVLLEYRKEKADDQDQVESCREMAEDITRDLRRRVEQFRSTVQASEYENTEGREMSQYEKMNASTGYILADQVAYQTDLLADAMTNGSEKWIQMSMQRLEDLEGDLKYAQEDPRSRVSYIDRVATIDLEVAKDLELAMGSPDETRRIGFMEHHPDDPEREQTAQEALMTVYNAFQEYREGWSDFTAFHQALKLSFGIADSEREEFRAHGRGNDSGPEEMSADWLKMVALHNESVERVMYAASDLERRNPDKFMRDMNMVREAGRLYREMREGGSDNE